MKCVEKGFESENNINSEFDASTTAIQASLDSKTKKLYLAKSIYYVLIHSLSEHIAHRAHKSQYSFKNGISFSIQYITTADNQIRSFNCQKISLYL